MKDNDQYERPGLKNSFRKDFSWYLLASFFPVLLGFLKTPIFTRHFSARDFGELGIISIGYNFMGVLFFSWIGSCLWRYFSKFQIKRDLKSLYSNLSFLMLISIFVTALISWVLYEQNSNLLQKRLIVGSFFQVLLNQLILLYMILIRLRSRSRDYTVFHASRGLTSLCISLIMVFFLDFDISALVWSLVITDLFFVIWLIIANPAQVSIGFSHINKVTILTLLRYGTMGLILNFSLVALTYSDRYVIALFDDYSSVGIYDQVYKIAQLSVMALITVFFNTINPLLLGSLESDFDGSLKLIRKYVYAYLLIGIPIIFYMSFFAEEISILLLGPEFRAAYTLMPFVFMATFVHGLANLYELRLKFSDQLKKLSILGLLSLLLNVVLNILLIPDYGYQWAAYSTLLTYLVMLIVLHFWDRGIALVLSNHWKLWLGMGLLFVIQGLVYAWLLQIFNEELWIKIMIGLIFVLVFFRPYYRKIVELDLPVE